jgi:hypothetical protein
LDAKIDGKVESRRVKKTEDGNFEISSLMKSSIYSTLEELGNDPELKLKLKGPLSSKKE